MRDRVSQLRADSAPDKAIFFLRLFIGAVMLLHIVGKLQNYSNISLHFQPLLGFDSATSLALSIIVEGALAAMLITGAGVRLSSLLMSIACAVALVQAAISSQITTPAAKLQFLYLGIYITLIVSGGGKYAMSRFLEVRKNVQKR